VTAFTVSGDPDVVLRLRVDSVAHLEEIVERVRRDPNVVRTRTMLVLSTILDRSVELS
jgi:DNA-binding Lrp family transcriptional regulator